MGLIGEADWHREGIVVVLQDSVSVSALIQSRHGLLKLLQTRAHVLPGPPPSRQIGLHHPAQTEVVAYICTLKEK